MKTFYTEEELSFAWQIVSEVCDELQGKGFIPTKELILEKINEALACDECHGTGEVIVGEFDNRETVECLCRKVEKEYQKEE